MRQLPTPSRALAALASALVLASACGGGGDGGTDPVTVASVVITAPAAPPSFQTLGRTVQFSASARDAANAPIAGASITWNSNSGGVASISPTGLVTAVANGTAQITASSGGIPSTGVAVTVAQVIDTVNPTPAAVAFGAIGSTRQLAAAALDSSDALVAGAPAIVWSRVGSGSVASVSPGGLATALAVGISDTAVATVGAKSTRIPISVTQVVASVSVTPTPTDTLRTTGRTKQYAASPRDSQANVMGTAVAWSSTVPSVATVNPSTGLATAVADGTTNIVATAGGIPGQRTLIVRRYAETFTMTPSAASITTPLGSQLFTGSAKDTIDTVLPISWLSRSTAILTVGPSSGLQTTATAVGNGQSYVVISAGTRLDSALVTVSGQVAVAPMTAAVSVGNFFFQSARNGTQNSAIDTVAAGGTVTWTWAAGSAGHNVNSDGAPSFTSSSVVSSGIYNFTFPNTGTYQYSCIIHSSMTGRVVVR